MDEQDGAAVADSPTADGTQATPPGAQTGVQAQPPVEKEPPFHQHPRFQQLIGENRASRAEAAQLRQALEQLQRRVEQPARTGEEREQRGAAIKALKELMAEDPELAELLEIRKEFPKVREATRGVEELSKGQLASVARQATTHIAGLAKAAGLTLDKENLTDFSRMVYQRALRIPGAADRFEQGDMDVLTEAFEGVKTALGLTGRAAATASTTFDAKNQLRRLPPRTTGGAGGREAPPTLDPDAGPKEVQTFTKRLAEMARAARGG